MDKNKTFITEALVKAVFEERKKSKKEIKKTTEKFISIMEKLTWLDDCSDALYQGGYSQAVKHIWPENKTIKSREDAVKFLCKINGVSYEFFKTVLQANVSEYSSGKFMCKIGMFTGKHSVHFSNGVSIDINDINITGTYTTNQPKNEELMYVDLISLKSTPWSIIRTDVFYWGSFGKRGHRSDFIQIPLAIMSDQHINAVLSENHTSDQLVRLMFNYELKYRQDKIRMREELLLNCLREYAESKDIDIYVKLVGVMQGYFRVPEPQYESGELPRLQTMANLILSGSKISLSPEFKSMLNFYNILSPKWGI